MYIEKFSNEFFLHTDNQKIILNSFCPTATFIEWIKKKCNFDQNGKLFSSFIYFLLTS